MKKLVTFLLFLFSTFVVAQDIKVITKDNDLKLAAIPYYNYGKGLGITSVQYLVFTAMAYLGYLEWKKSIKKM